MAAQQSLFADDPPDWEQDAAGEALTATVVMAGAGGGAAGEFDYLVPDQLADPRNPETRAEPGRRVLVPFGRGDRRLSAYCVAVGVKPRGARRLKSLLEVLDPAPLISESMLRLARWMAEYYLTPLGQVLETVLPAGVRGAAGTREVTLLSVPTAVAARLTRLELPEKQRRALESLAASTKPLSPPQLAKLADCTTAPINALRKKGLVESRVERLDTAQADELLAPTVERQQPKQLNKDQAHTLATILAALEAPQSQTVLIHGVTGSGKTEVYIQAIERVVGFGRQAIVLVPEISLTPQTVGRFRERFDHIAVLHSHQSDVERHRQWRRIAAGEIQVVVGARSAVFAPTPHLGLIVIDEEHETSFKQDTAPRYHAREVARRRAEAARAPLVLSSATPSLEAWVRADGPDPDALLASMPRRVGGLPMPDVRTIDLVQEAHGRGGRGAISRPLSQAIHASLEDRGQVILLLNRRGFSTHVRCPSCGYLLECPHCETALTFHRDTNVALCHWCDYREPPPRICPDCKSAGVNYHGLGTQKLEAEVRARFPSANVLRMDTDTMRSPGSHERALDAFRRGEVQVLLGTQMIAKGLDFPNVTLVGVINADSALHWPDFRASERTFQLVTQVAGRTGRGERGGRVMVQTFEPGHPAIAAAVRHDYAAFAAGELPEREALGYPPYGSVVRMIARGENAKLVEALLAKAADTIRRHGEEFDAMGPAHALRVIGPAPAPLEKLRGEYRFHLLVRSRDGAALHRVMQRVAAELEAPDGVRWVVDVDPVDMM
ncbi:Primosomal protein N' [Pseudobythopirellula maris]|uniref:Replication restart protein PriA n=1 Tax=Pseudobythopirellula maris TaxID=2527991 RepID=A0A5C5ZKN2_9BACT|nr:primosomal protein N' [Pseudobythopirellula maris]TWT87361.1 Primosomal protein N' [Pseudobythopirellula maris]